MSWERFVSTFYILLTNDLTQEPRRVPCTVKEAPQWIHTAHLLLDMALTNQVRGKSTLCERVLEQSTFELRCDGELPKTGAENTG